MRQFAQLDDEQRDRLFERPPCGFDRDAERDVLARGLGATLYMPAVRPDLVADLQRCQPRGITSTVVCLEDSVPDHLVGAATENLVTSLRRFHTLIDGARDAGPLIFIRTRSAVQIREIVDRLGEAITLVSGFVLPKFDADRGPQFLAELSAAEASTGSRLFFMPVVETPEVMHLESRREALHQIHALTQAHRDRTLAIRIGATDLCAVYGIRRDMALTVYDVRMVAQAISDIVNVLGRADGTGFLITGPVWEHFDSERILKPQLRETPFRDHSLTQIRADLISRSMDGLIREVILDRAQGLDGKSIIHPSHAPAVHALCVVPSDEYADALAIAGQGGTGGASAAPSGGRMNESKPHWTWAQRTLLRAQAFGVSRPETGFVDILAAGGPH